MRADAKTKKLWSSLAWS